MLVFFRNNNILTYAALLVYTAILRLSPYFLHPSFDIHINAPLSQFIFQDLGMQHISPTLNYLLASLLLFIQAFWLNYISSQHNFMPSYSTIPALLFITINSIYPQQMLLNPQLLSNTFLILLFQRLCYLYESPRPLYLALEAGFYLGTAMLFNYDLITYLIFIIAAVITMTSFNLRFITVSLIGLILPIYFITVFFYLMNRLNDFIAFVKNSFENGFINVGNFPVKMLYPWAFIIFLSIIGLLKIQARFLGNNVKTRRILIMSFLMLILSLPVLFIQMKNLILNLIYLSVPVSIAIAYFLSENYRTRLKEFLFFILLALSISYSYISI